MSDRPAPEVASGSQPEVSESAPKAVTIPISEDQLAAIHYDDKGLVPAIVQAVDTGQVLMMAWMNEATLRRSLAEGRTVFWSRSRQEVWAKGETSGERQWIRQAFYDCDGDTLLFRVEQDGDGACHTGAVSCFHNPFGNQPAGSEPKA